MDISFGNRRCLVGVSGVVHSTWCCLLPSSERLWVKCRIIVLSVGQKTFKRRGQKEEKKLEQGGKQTASWARIIKEKVWTKRRVPDNPAVFSGHLSLYIRDGKWCTRRTLFGPHTYGQGDRSCRLIRTFKARKKDGLFSIWLMSIAPCPASFVPTLDPQGNETMAPIQVANLLPRRQAFH